MDCDSKISGQCPRSCCPDDYGGFVGEFSARDRKHDIDRRGCFVLVFDLRLGQRGLGSGAPQHGFFLTINQSGFHKSAEGPDDVRLIGRIEREVGMLPVAKDPEPAELRALDVDKFAGVFLGTAAHLCRRKACR